ncbi:MULTISPECIES: hypothetical protein [unclassified Leisingera]|uniref:hypothetical protein n=1 Tax=unclassified Leisingera TaxID=2614906 RepID=UPI0002EB81D1|nr:MULTISPECIES: hypothetical protein [unclassified Leisingera]KIC22831.1 hypothetical protein RA23_17985 [Leisingera sp. ANG-S3]KIC52593.1 hypothetical protein RA22_15030 [Leisingera sp. ANG-S]KID07529.1 hypothetical protein GC1_19125 [Leisingera sp. ANG1]
MLAQNTASSAAALIGRRRTLFHSAAKAAAVLGLALMALQPSAAAAQQTYVVGSDRGGYLHDRLIELKNLQQNGVRVEIRGKVCYSTCTMFLGLPGACVDPATTFGFHGPSRGGRRLTQEKFDYFSRVMAGYYPAPLKSWFMAEGRNRISGVHKIKGSEIIRMGVPACRNA